jgi:hypothetical protein
MPFRPNFTDVELIDEVVRVGGISGEEDLPDIVDIRVVLVQGERIASGFVDKVTPEWHADVPVRDPDGTAADFRADEVAVAFGAETRKENAMTITWVEGVKIK